MGLKLVNGDYVVGRNGLLQEASPKEELLQNAAMHLSLARGSFPYGRELGSRLGTLDAHGDHAAEQAVSFANEALMDMPGVRTSSAAVQSDGQIRFAVDTPLGEGEIIFEKQDA